MRMSMPLTAKCKNALRAWRDGIGLAGERKRAPFGRAFLLGNGLSRLAKICG